MRLAKPAVWLLIIVATYSLGQALWYWQTPLGQFPVLDGLENLILADSIRNGTLPKEPFYRAMLYPAVLALIPIHWIALGLLSHLANAFLAMGLSYRVWSSQYAALITGTLVGLNPVLLHFALDPLDITLSISLLLLSLFFLIPRSEGAFPKTSSLAFSGLFLGLAALARPHFFAILIPICLIAIGMVLTSRIQWLKVGAFLGAAAIPLLALGLIQNAHSDSFRVMPTQGAYSFWVSNHSKANGLYYKQTLNFHYTDEHKNPARLESEELYRRETGNEGSTDERLSYWKRKTLGYILENPFEWSKLMAFKGYAWLNNHEQYNNKTFSFHKILSPFLRYNPICWGLLLTLSLISIVLSRKRLSQRVLWSGIALILLYSAGSLLYMASARFRLPLVPLLAIAAGGIPLALSSWKSLSLSRRIGGCFLALLLAVTAFSKFGSIASPNTIQQDTMLLADASSRLGKDLEAFNWSEATLSLDSNRQDARRLRVLSFYNLVATGRENSTGKTWDDFRVDLQQISLSDPYIDFVRGVAHWNYQQPDVARSIWKDTFEKHAWDASSSLAALIYTESSIDFSIPSYPSTATNPNSLLLFALNRSDKTDLCNRIGFHFTLSNEYHASIEANLQRVLPAQPNDSF